MPTRLSPTSSLVEHVPVPCSAPFYIKPAPRCLEHVRHRAPRLHQSPQLVHALGRLGTRGAWGEVDGGDTGDTRQARRRRGRHVQRQPRCPSGVSKPPVLKRHAAQREARRHVSRHVRRRGLLAPPSIGNTGAFSSRSNLFNTRGRRDGPHDAADRCRHQKGTPALGFTSLFSPLLTTSAASSSSTGCGAPSAPPMDRGTSVSITCPRATTRVAFPFPRPLSPYDLTHLSSSASPFTPTFAFLSSSCDGSPPPPVYDEPSSRACHHRC